MKYFSELTNKTYNSEAECIEAEKAFKEEELKKAEKLNATSKRKKELSKLIEAADLEADKEYQNYHQVKEDASKIIAEAETKADKMIREAAKRVSDARKKKYQAISDFNKEFGTYVVQYDDDKALKDLKQANDWLNEIFGKFFF